MLPKPGNKCNGTFLLMSFLINLILPETIDSLAYISAADSMGLSSFKFLWLRTTHLFLQQSAYRPFKVIQGR